MIIKVYAKHSYQLSLTSKSFILTECVFCVCAYKYRFINTKWYEQHIIFFVMKTKIENQTKDTEAKQQTDDKINNQQTEEIPSTSGDNLSSPPSDVGRSYSPIIEERDSRPASTDPIDDRKGSVSSKPADSGSSMASRSVSPALETPVNSTEASATKSTLSVDKSPLPSRQTTPEPIFRPLYSDKGTSKTTGKTIGGWI